MVVQIKESHDRSTFFIKKQDTKGKEHESYKNNLQQNNVSEKDWRIKHSVNPERIENMRERVVLVRDERRCLFLPVVLYVPFIKNLAQLFCLAWFVP